MLSFDPPEDSQLTAVHGAVGEFVDRIDFVNVTDDEVDGEYCLRFVFRYGNEQLEPFAMSSDIRC